MRRRDDGFALIAVLWLIVVLGAVAGVRLWAATYYAQASRNRIVLLRADWAARACFALLEAGAAGRRIEAGEKPLDLGHGAWCSAKLLDPAARLNVNRADSATLARALGSPAMAAALMDWRDADTLPRAEGAERGWYRQLGRPGPRDGPLHRVDELRLVRGFDARSPRWGELFTTSGSDRVNLNTAPEAVLRALPGMSSATVEALLRHRGLGDTVQAATELADWVPPGPREAFLSSYGDLVRVAETTPDSLAILIRGGVRGYSPEAHVRLQVVARPHGLSLVTREDWL